MGARRQVGAERATLVTHMSKKQRYWFPAKRYGWG